MDRIKKKQTLMNNMIEKNKKVLVAGGTGYLGGYVIKEFKRQDYFVRALTRKAGRFGEAGAYVDEEFVGEITVPGSLEGACRNIDVVFTSVGITKQKDNLTFMDVDYRGNKNLLDEALKAGVSKFIFISVFGAHDMKDLKVMEAKFKFEEELRASGIDFTIIYPNGFFSDMIEYRKMAEKGRVYLFGDGNNKINPIHGADLAEVCVNAAEENEKKIEAGGPDILTHKEIAELAFEAVGKKKKITTVPVWIGKGLLGLMKLLTPVKTYGGFEFFMSVLIKDLIAPAQGKHHLKDVFENRRGTK